MGVHTTDQKKYKTRGIKTPKLPDEIVTHKTKVIFDVPEHELLAQRRYVRKQREEATEAYKNLIRREEEIFEAQQMREHNASVTVQSMDESDEEEEQNAHREIALYRQESNELVVLRQTMEMSMVVANIIPPHIREVCEGFTKLLAYSCIGPEYAPIIVRYWTSQVSHIRTFSSFIEALMYRPACLEYQENNCLSLFKNAPHLFIERSLLPDRTTGLLKKMCNPEGLRMPPFFKHVHIDPNGVTLRRFEQFAFNDHLQVILEPLRITLLNDVACEMARTGKLVFAPYEALDTMTLQFQSLILHMTTRIELLTDGDKRISNFRPKSSVEIMDENKDEKRHRNVESILTETQVECRILQERCRKLYEMSGKLQTEDFWTYVKDYEDRGQKAMSKSKVT